MLGQRKDQREHKLRIREERRQPMPPWRPGRTHLREQVLYSASRRHMRIGDAEYVPGKRRSPGIDANRILVVEADKARKIRQGGE